METYSFSEDEAQRARCRTKILSDLGYVSYLEDTNHKNSLWLSRRHAVRALAWGAGIVTTVVGGVVTLEAQRYGLFQDLSFDPRFIQFLNENRQSGDLEAKAQNRFKNLSQEEKDFTSLLVSFGAGFQLEGDNAEKLHRFLRRAADPTTRLIVSDLLTSHLIRSGELDEARHHFLKIGADELKSEELTLIYCEKAFSLAYNNLTEANALAPHSWGFETGLYWASTLGLDHHLTIQDRTSWYDVEAKGCLKIPKSGPLAGIKGFYIINYSLLYAAASHPHESAHYADVLFDTLRQYAQNPAFTRAVWNMAYMVGLLYHRLAPSALKPENEFKHRDAFWSICFGEAHDFWPHKTEIAKRISGEYLSSDDNVALCMVLFLLSDPNVKLPWAIKNVAGAEKLLNHQPSIKPRRLQQAVNQLRVKLGPEHRPLSGPQAFQQNFAPDGSLGALLPKMDEIANHFE